MSVQELQAGYLLGVAFTANLLLDLLALAVPLYAQHLGASPFEIGIIGGAGGVIYAISPYFTGRLTDRFGHHRTTLAAQGLLVLVGLAYIISSSLIALALVRLVEGLTWALLWPSIETGIATAFQDKARGLRRYNVAWSTGALVGPLLGGALMTYLSPTAPFLLTLVTALGALALGLPVFRSFPKARQQQMGGASRRVEGLRWRVPFTPYLSAFIYAYVLGVVRILFPPYAVTLGYSEFQAGALLFAMGLARTLGFTIAPRVQYALSPRRMVQVGPSLVGGSALIVWVLNTPVGYLLGLVGVGLFAALTYAASLYLIFTTLPQQVWGRYSGLFEGSIGMGLVVGPLTGGAIATLGMGLPFLLCGPIGLLGLIVNRLAARRGRV